MVNTAAPMAGNTTNNASQPPTSSSQNARPTRPILQQSNQMMKRLALIGLQMKQSDDPKLKSEAVKEPFLTYLTFLADRILDYSLTTLCSYPQRLTIEDVEDYCGNFLGYVPTAPVVVDSPSAASSETTVSYKRPFRTYQDLIKAHQRGSVIAVVNRKGYGRLKRLAAVNKIGKRRMK